jgi:uncharacterized protein (DUF58 family)
LSGARVPPPALLRRLPGWLWNRQVKTTRAGYAFMGLLIVVGVAAGNTGNNLLYLVEAMMFAVLFASFLLSEYSLENLYLERELPRRVHAGAEFTLTYRVQNRKRWLASYAVLVQDHSLPKPAASSRRLQFRLERLFQPVELGPSRTAALIVRVPAGQTETAVVRFREPRRGRVHWEQVSLSTRYPFGFFVKSRAVALPAEVVVYPALLAEEPAVVAPAGRPGSAPMRRRGSGGELWKFRDYQPDDSLRWVHWKTSARAGRLLVREHEEEQERRVTLRLQFSAPRPLKDNPARERALSEAASLARHFILRDYQVRLEAGHRGLNFGHGPDHLQRILHFLALFDSPDSPDPGEPLASSEGVRALVFS